MNITKLLNFNTFTLLQKNAVYAVSGLNIYPFLLKKLKYFFLIIYKTKPDNKTKLCTNLHCSKKIVQRKFPS